MIINARQSLVGATFHSGRVARLSSERTLQRDSEILFSLCVAAILVIAKVLELYATHAI